MLNLSCIVCCVQATLFLLRHQPIVRSCQNSVVYSSLAPRKRLIQPTTVRSNYLIADDLRCLDFRLLLCLSSVARSCLFLVDGVHWHLDEESVHLYFQLDLKQNL